MFSHLLRYGFRLPFRAHHLLVVLSNRPTGLVREGRGSSCSQRVLVGKVSATSNLKNDIKRCVGLIGGFETFIKKGDRFLVKPNYNSDSCFPASSDPEFVRATVELLFEGGAKDVIVTESSGIPWLPTRRVLEKTGLIEVLEGTGARILALDHAEWVNVRLNGRFWTRIAIPKVYFDVDKVIFLPLIKAHRFAKFSLSLKLGVGFVHLKHRFLLHLTHLEEKIAELNKAFRPDLIIMDGRKCLVTGGPDSGETRESNRILASTDRIAIDIEALKILRGYDSFNEPTKHVWEYPQIKFAVEAGLGVSSEEEYKVIER